MSDWEEDALNGADWNDDEESDFACPECEEELLNDGTCINETCEYFESAPYGGGSHADDAREERRQMGITS